MDKPTLAPKPPNADGETICHVRWMAETPAGWLGSWDRQAFDWVNAELDRLRADRDALLALLRECRPVVMTYSPSGKPFDFPRELVDRIDAALTPNARLNGQP